MCAECADRFDVLADLVEAYEDRRFPIPDLDPIELLRAHMEMTGRTQADLAKPLGSTPRAPEVPHRKRALTVRMIHKLAKEWGLPADALVARYHLAAWTRPPGPDPRPRLQAFAPAARRTIVNRDRQKGGSLA